MKSVAFLTLGCKVNSYETNGMEKLFLESGYEIKSFSECADVYVINTCTVTNMADRKSRQMLHRAKKMNPQAVIAAVGCYVQASREEVEKDEAIDLVIGNNQKSKIVEAVENYLKEKEIKKNASKENDKMTAPAHTCVDEMKNFHDFEETKIVDAGEKTRAYIKIQDGCNQFCSYCIIPYVRGRIRSRKEEDIIEEITELAKKGYREVVLTGIHLSSYGVDLLGESDFVKEGGRPLLSIIQKVSEIEGIKRIRLGSLEPRIITEEFVAGLSKIEEVCPHFHLSLQSGCDATLERMNRKYSAEEYLEKCAILRKYYKAPAITTDIIVGFPGETEEEFEETERFMDKAAFSDVHIFKYSVRKGTKAEKMENQVSEQKKAERSARLIKKGEKLRELYNKEFIGTKQQVLWEEFTTIETKDGLKKCFTGHNERYVKIACITNDETIDLHNRLTEAKIYAMEKDGILLADTGLF